MQDAPESEKLSAAPSLNVRVGPTLRGEIDKLAVATKRKPSDVVRVGLMAYWPEIKALNEAISRTASDEEVVELRAYLDACKEAKRLGIDPRQVLLEATSQLIECPPAPSPPAPEPESAVA